MALPSSFVQEQGDATKRSHQLPKGPGSTKQYVASPFFWGSFARLMGDFEKSNPCIVALCQDHLSGL